MKNIYVLLILTIVIGLFSGCTEVRSKEIHYIEGILLEVTYTKSQGGFQGGESQNTLIIFTNGEAYKFYEEPLKVYGILKPLENHHIKIEHQGETTALENGLFFLNVTDLGEV